MTRIKNVRNTTKFKRSIKAISPVIATLLMIAIAVVASLVVYAWVTGYMGNTTSKAGKAIQIQSFATSGNNLVVYVQNVGQGDVELNKDQSVYINSNLVPISNPTTTTIPIIAGQTVELTLPLPAGYAQGDRLNIKVTTKDGTFMTASGTGGSTNPTTPATTYAVNFVLGTPGGLSMNPTGAQTVGGTIAITATANSGYHFTSWTSSTGSITFGDANLASTSATINGAGTVTANFAADTVQYSVTFALGANGATITPTAGAHSYDAGSSVPITATANSGYHFTSWTSSTGSITFGDANLASTSATINGAGTVTANFAADTVQYSVTFALGANGATITPTAGAHSYDAGSSVPITATANSGYHFTSWTSTTTSITFSNANSASTTATIGAAGTVTANFAANTAVVVTLSPTANSGGWTNPTRAYADDTNYATSTSNNNAQVYSGYGFAIPAGATITQVRVRVDAFVSNNDLLRLAVSSNGGSTFTTAGTDINPGTSQVTTWKDVTSLATWTVANINNNQIQTRITQIQGGGTADTVSLDWIPIEVTYIPA